MSTDTAWGRIGNKDPYFGVFSADRFHGGEDKDAFFHSGELHVERVLAAVRELVPGFAPRRTVDFGCGVGRLVIPFSRISGAVVGIDVSPGMLEEARKNCESRGIANVQFVSSPAQLEGRFDFVHSFFVFQHIPVGRGLPLAQALVERLEDDGIGALHFIYSDGRSPLRRLIYRLFRVVPGVYRLANIARRRTFNFPMVQMNSYPMERLLGMLESLGCHRIGGYLADQGDGYLGVVLIFQRRRLRAPY
jgi:SAM-dependent methyltransferase